MHELEGERRIEVTAGKERTVPSCRFSFAKLAVRMTRRGRRHEIQKNKDAMFDISFDAKGFRRHLRNGDDCKLLVTERAHDALSRKRLRYEKVNIAG